MAAIIIVLQSYYAILQCMQFDWQGFINYMYNLTGLNVPQDLEIVVTTPAYFQRLGPLLQNTDPGYVSIAIYMQQQILQRSDCSHL